MAGRAQIPAKSSALIAMIADEDTVTGFLLAGVGNVDLRRKMNYFIVDSKTTVKQIEDAFKEFTNKEDIAVVLISQYIANMIRFLVDSYNRPVPAILEIPSKDHPYDPTHDSVLSRIVPETLEPSLQLTAAVLAQAKLPMSETAATINEFRSCHLSELTELCQTSGSSLDYGYWWIMSKPKPSLPDDENDVVEGTLAI